MRHHALVFRFPVRAASAAVVFTALVATGALPARAQMVTRFDDRTVFNTANAGTTFTVINFENMGYTTGAATGTTFGAGLTISGTSFIGINDTIQVIDGFNVGTPNNAVLTVQGQGSSSQDSILITLPSGGVNAFGTDIKDTNQLGGAAPQASGGVFNFTLFSGTTNLGSFQAKPVLFNNFAFIGFTSDTPITSIRLGANSGVGGGRPVLDNLEVGPTFGAVPEPGTFALGGAALGPLAGAVLVRRKRRRRAA